MNDTPQTIDTCPLAGRVLLEHGGLAEDDSLNIFTVLVLPDAGYFETLAFARDGFSIIGFFFAYHLLEGVK
ncbi:MAG: hypothetical protein ACFFD4_09820 [Candidatus Odinarchaeota archaeon]